MDINMRGLYGKIILSIFLLSPLAFAARPLDPDRYITIDEIKPGMDAYCLTAYKGAEAEKFGLEVLSVVRDISPGRNAIMVQGTDERFIHTGPVAGCSGSPVYIEGRLAGALAFGWLFSKDPLYGVTPIEEMLGVSDDTALHEESASKPAFALDFSKPVNLAQARSKLADLSAGDSQLPQQAVKLPCPLITSGLPDSVVKQLDGWVEPFGLMAVAGAAGSNAAKGSGQIVPGAPLSLPLVTGDITMTAIGTATEVKGDKVYAFGHSFLGYGPVNLPMGTGHIHTVVSTVVRSFKLGSATGIVGALRVDESTAVLGRIGREARMIPLSINVTRYNDRKQRTYDCRLADNQILTPMLLDSALAGAAYMRGAFPPDHKVEYRASIDVEGFEPISFSNLSSCRRITELTGEAVGAVALLMNNPYRQVQVNSLDFEMTISDENVLAQIWTANVSDTKFEAGDTVDLEIVVEPYLEQKEKYHCSLVLPKTLPPGKYKIIITGPAGYQSFIRKSAPYRFTAQNMKSLVDAIRRIVKVKRNRLYCILELPPGGLAIEGAELPELPTTKALVLANEKRALRVLPYRHWKEKSIETGTLILDKAVLQIEVKE